VNAPRITDQLFQLFPMFVFLLCRLTSGAFKIDSSTPTLRRNLNEHPIYFIVCLELECVTFTVNVERGEIPFFFIQFLLTKCARDSLHFLPSP
jgi:hypothetical protein